LSRELWWTGSPVAIFENENQWEIAEIPGWFSPGDFVLILKNFLLLWERMRFAKYKMFYKISLHKILLFLQNTLSSTYSMHYI
jgi:thioredoxin-related protein